MGLIDLKTDLKNLKYGKDTLGGGYSGQPYIQTPIPEDFNDLGARKDFILRGGANTARDTATDVQRLTKMFFDLKSPNGVLFISKQNVLSQTGVRTQSSGVVNEGTYTPLNTLAQAGVIVSGGHLNKQGDPFLETGAYSNNDVLYGVKVKPTQPIEDNRLARLYQLVSINSSDKLDGFILNNGNVLTYEGGPNSILGVGKTNIRFASQRTGKQNSISVSNPNFFIGKNNQRSVNIEDEQVGGLQVNPNKSWITSGLYGLPDFTINSPQSSSLLNIPYGPLTWTSKQNITGSNIVNGQYSKYNPLLTGISGVNSVYEKILSVNDVERKLRDFEGNKLLSNNVYISGTLDPNINVTQGLQTPKQDITNPNGITYRIGSPTSPEYNISESKGITNVLGLTQPSFINPSVYKSGSKYPQTQNDDKTGGSNTSQANQTITYNPSQISGSTSYNTVGKLIDFRKVIRDSITNTTLQENYTNTGQLAKSLTYSDNNIGVRNQIGNPGANRRNKKYGSYQTGVIDVDGKNKPLDIINASKVGDDPSTYNDLVTFNICPLNNNNWMTFRAFLGSFSDNYSSTINSQQYVGRGENFYTYGGFSRKISLSWTVAALSKQELIPMYKRLSYLASNTAPIYNDGFMQGPLVKLTVGGYLHEMPGYIESLNFEIGEDSTWEIQIGDKDGSIDRTVSELSHIIKVTSFNFIPIPNYLPQQGAHFIDLWNGEKILWENDSTSIN
jgi:hypothetical protein